jgi:hypothetical protein
MSSYDQKIAEFLMKDINEKAVTPKKDPFWAALNGTGTKLDG